MVKIEIEQTLTLERQAFDARMKITNTLDTIPLENVNISVNFEDADGKQYLVGATLTYDKGGVEEVIQVAPDDIYVKPTPLLTLDYFLPDDVTADDTFTTTKNHVLP